MPSHTPDHWIFDRQDAVAIVAVNPLRVLNAVGPPWRAGLRRRMLAFGHDAFVRAMVRTGAEDKAFVAVTGQSGS